MTDDKLNSPIFITGVERSGSSIVARIVNHCGAFTGSVTEMFENIQIKKLLDSYYELLGVDKRGQWPLPDAKKLIIPTNWKQKVEDVLTEEQYGGFTSWMFKGSRLCQTWPVWHYAYPNAKWIIVRRRTPDIIESCLKTGYMKAYKDSEGWLDWIHFHEKIFVEMIEAGVNCKQVWPERMVIGDYQQVHEMIDWVGLEWDLELVKIIEPLMWNSKQRTK
jgi:hypothetical protein